MKTLEPRYVEVKDKPQSNLSDEKANMKNINKKIGHNE